MSNQGTIVQIIGAVVDADFSKATSLPEIYNALEIQYVLNGVDTKLVLEVREEREVLGSAHEPFRSGRNEEQDPRLQRPVLDDGCLDLCLPVVGPGDRHADDW